MSVDHLVRMANDIASFFDAEADKTQAARSMADHLRRFWAPPMRASIVAHLRSGGEGLAPLSRAAVALLDGAQGHAHGDAQGQAPRTT